MAVVVRSSSLAAGNRVSSQSFVAYVVVRRQESPVGFGVELELVAGDRALADRAVAGGNRWGPLEVVVVGTAGEGGGDEESEEEEEEEERGSACFG